MGDQTNDPFAYYAIDRASDARHDLLVMQHIEALTARIAALEAKVREIMPDLN